MCRTVAVAFLTITCSLFADPHQLQATITTTGDISPEDPSTWTLSKSGYVGSTLDGTVIIDDGSSVSVEHLYLGSNSGATGVVTVDGIASSLKTYSLNVGISGNGTLRVTDGGSVVTGGYASTDMTIASSASSSSQVVVGGAGSSLIDHSNLYIGHLGNGTLSIYDGATVAVDSATYVADGAGSTGAITFGTSGGTLTTGGLATAPRQLHGTGTIIAHGLVSDVNLVLDSPASLTQTLRLNSLGQDITLNLDMTNSCSCLGAGWQDAGALTIQNGTVVSSGWGCIGYAPGSIGVVSVKGTGSKWINGGNIIGTGLLSGGLHVGYYGVGTLRITEGAVVGGGYAGTIAALGTVTVDGSGSQWTGIAINVNGALEVKHGGNVTVQYSYIGRNSGSVGIATVSGEDSSWKSSYLYVGMVGTGTLYVDGGAIVRNGSGIIGGYSGSKGTVTVEGVGSRWNNTYLSVGSSGTGMLNVIGGAVVKASNVSINSKSILAIDVGRGSTITVKDGTGTFTDKGTVRILAGANVASGAYIPISAGTWSGSGKYQAVGGTWNTSTHVFTVSDLQEGLSGMVVSLGLRGLIDDAATGWSVGASFDTPVTMTVTAISGKPLMSLKSLAGDDQTVFGAWQFLPNSGYVSGDPAYLSFDVGVGVSQKSLEIWHYDGTNWTPYSTTDLTYDGQYASFTVTGFSGYAVTGLAAVPEPGTIVLLLVAAGLTALTYRQWRR